MAKPITLDIPHKLGRDAARARIEAGSGRMASFIPGGTVTDHRWEGDSLFFTVAAMGQTVATRLDVHEDRVHALLDLPPLLGMFAERIRAKLQKDAPRLLE